ncbi:MAG: carbohydrate kinase family protein [Patescibacteria group bacterium]|jgi:sugar/nucleoside kinase (ribokinase family)
MYDVITFGSATRDVFIRSSALEIIESDDATHTMEGCFPLGAKIEINNLVLETGGGATNAATTFSRLGYSTAIVSSVGNDDGGRAVLETLRSERISTGFMQTDRDDQTAFSAIILTGTGERTVLVYRGASEMISAKLIPWQYIGAKWFYITSLGGKLALMEKTLNFAKKNGIKVAWNPGTKELRHGLDRLTPLIRKTDVFNLNVEEAMLLTGRRDRDIAALRDALRGLPRQALMITDGKNGAYVANHKDSWHVAAMNVKHLNVTGAGDAFGSGFVAGLMKKDDLRYGLAVGIWNASSVIQQMGAKRGIINNYPSAGVLKRISIDLWK